MQEYIKVRGAKEHNLKDINVDIHWKKLSEQADRSLYIAKDLWRNRSEEYTGETDKLYLWLQKNKQNKN